MQATVRLPWERIHEFLLDVGRMRDPRNLCVRAIERIQPLIPYDQARIYFVGDNGKICDEVLFGVEKHWSDAYIEHFSRIDNGRYAILSRSWLVPPVSERGRQPFAGVMGSVYDWEQVEPDEFITGYIRPQGLRHSAGFAFHSADDSTRSIYMVDRTSRSGFTPREIEIMRRIQPHLENLHKNLTIQELYRARERRERAARAGLTEREAEIGGLLCKGLTPSAISGRLCLSLATVYKHIANMHDKLGVSNRQELLLKLMDPR